MKMNRAVVWFPECQINTPHLLRPSSFSPTLSPFILFFAAIIFPSSSPLLRLKNWHVFDKGKSTPDDKRFSSTPFPPLSWVENEQHSFLSLLSSRSKESIIVSPATRTVSRRLDSGRAEKCVGTSMRLCQNNRRRLMERSGGRFYISSPHNGFRF